MGNKLLRFQRVTLVLGAATVTLLCVPCATHAQSFAPQDRQAVQSDAGGQNRGDDRRDVASFDRFLDQHREIAQQVRKDPSLLDNRNFVQNHPELQTYFQDNPGVRDQIRQDPNGFMRQEDAFDRDTNMRDRDTGAVADAAMGEMWRILTDSSMDIAKSPNRFAKTHRF